MTQKYNGSAWVDCADRVLKTATDTATIYPATLRTAQAGALTNYRIYGTSEGAGVETENIWSDENARLRYWISANGVLDTNNRFGAVSTDIIVNPGDVISFAFFGEGHRSHFIAFYDANGFVSREYTPDETSVHTVPPGITRCYLGVATENDVSRSGLISIKSVWQKSSTAPTSYIPPGYKIPLTNTSGVTENVLIDDPYKTNYYINENGQETAQGGFSIYVTEALDTSLGEYSFYFANMAANTYARVHGYSNGVWQQQITTLANTHSATITKPQGIDEIRISCANGYTGRTLVKGSTAPDHYIPHRYTADYNLYIGDTKLGAEEYVDYAEQKVYKRTENLCFKRIDSANIDSVGVISTLSGSYLYVAKVEQGKVYSTNINPTGNTVFAWYENEPEIGSTAYDNLRTVDNFVNVTAPINGYVAIRWTIIMDTSIVQSSESPSSYIPYLQPTNPPAPLPEITLSAGDNDVSFSTTVLPAEFDATFEGWHDGTESVYDGQEWN